MKRSIQFLFICIASAFLLTSCYTVKGAVRGAGEDVSVIAGQDGTRHHYRERERHEGMKHHHAKGEKAHHVVKGHKPAVKVKTTKKTTTQDTTTQDTTSTESK